MKVAKAKQCTVCHEEEATMCIIINKVQICRLCYHAMKIDAIVFRIIRFMIGPIK